jgi:S1-C subfamily serine protease
MDDTGQGFPGPEGRPEVPPVYYSPQTPPLYSSAPGVGAGPPPRRPARNSGRAVSFLKPLIAGVVGALLVLLVMPAVFGVNPVDIITGKVKKAATVASTSPATIKQVTSVVSPTQGATDVASIAKKITPSIVNIDVKTSSRGMPYYSNSEQEGTGSGVIYSSDGYIITNNHVVSGASTITVTLASGTELPATVVGTDPDNDVAVIKINKTGLPALSLGNSDGLVVGQMVVAVGSPLGFEQTVTSGIVSALHRNVTASSDGSSEVLTDLIQTDAPINPGNSGGALCDGTGMLIGVNTLIASQSGGSEGIGFAIPVNTVKQVADDIIAGRKVSHPYIGVQGQSVSSDIAAEYGLPVSEGAYVTYVAPGSPAQKAGIKNGDIIVAADGQPVKTVDTLMAAVKKKSVGQTINLTYYNGNDKKSVDVTVEETPSTIE